MKIKFYLSPEQGESSSTEVEGDGIPTIDAAETMPETIDDLKDTNNGTNEKPKNEEKPAASTGNESEGKSDEQPDRKSANPADDKSINGNESADESEKGEVKELTFEVPADDEGSTEAENSSEKESSWVDIAKEQGLEIKEDSFESYKEAINKSREDAISQAKEEGRKIELEKYSPDAQKLIKFLNENPEATIEDFTNPVKVLDDVLKLDDEGIIKKDLELKGWEAEKIEKKLEMLKDDGDLDTVAYELRKIVEHNRESLKNNIIEERTIARKEREATIEKQNEKLTILFYEELDKADKFMEFKIPQKAKEHIKKEWAAGKVQESFKQNPKEVLSFVLNKYLGAAYQKELSKTSYQNGRDDVQDNLHNIKPLNSEGAGKKPGRDAKLDNPFEAWNSLHDQNVTIEQ